jgi:hypothetical protein
MKYRSKQVIVEAIQFDGYNHDEIKKFSEGKVGSAKPYKPNYVQLEVHTLEGIMDINISDYVIKGLEGEFYPCKESIFLKKYEPVDEE